MPTMSTQRLILIQHGAVATDGLLDIAIVRAIDQAVDLRGGAVRLESLAPPDLDGALPPGKAAPAAVDRYQPQHHDIARLGISRDEHCSTR